MFFLQRNKLNEDKGAQLADSLWCCYRSHKLIVLQMENMNFQRDLNINRYKNFIVSLFKIIIMTLRWCRFYFLNRIITITIHLFIVGRSKRFTIKNIYIAVAIQIRDKSQRKQKIYR